MNGFEKDLTPLNPADLAAEPDFTLGVLFCRPSLLTVTAGARTETLEPRVMQVLVTLARLRGEVVSRDQLVELCWEGRVVSDSALHRCTLRLRKISETLGGFTLETIRRVGYRLVEVPAAMAPQAEPQPVPHPYVALIRRSALPLLALLVVLFATTGLLRYRATEAEREQFNAALANIRALVEQDQYGPAFTLAQPLSAGTFARSPDFEALWKRIVLPMRPLVAEDGATVWFKPYSDTDGPWIYAGATPFVTPVDAPRGPLRIRVEKPGFRTGYFVVHNSGPSVVTEESFPSLPEFTRPDATIALPLGREGTVHGDVVQVPHTNAPIVLRGWSYNVAGDHAQDVPAFAIARTEVTNREFKEFIDAGGYDQPECWRDLDFRENGQSLSWEDARRRFVDRTGRPGPADWELSTYPAGAASLPVTGISWYEAAAYACYRGRQLPTIHHWARAAFSPYEAYYGTGPAIALHSHFWDTQPVAADAELGWGPWGTLHMAGNVSEWIANPAADGEALALGGSWADFAQAYFGTLSAQPMTRLPQIGMRLMQADAPLDPELIQPVALRDDIEITRTPVSAEDFAVMRMQFTATHAPPVAQTVKQVAESERWVADEVVLRYATGNSATFFIARPRATTAPLQPVIFGPPGVCCIMKRPNIEVLEWIEAASLEFIMNSGRALVLPIWAGSYERDEPPPADAAAEADSQRRLALLYHEDASRVIDYLETLPDIDATRVGYLSASSGSSVIAPIVLATEDRIKAAVLVSGGISLQDNLHPMYDGINYVSRIEQPVLMLNGRFDAFVEYEKGQVLQFELLATPDDRKEHKVYDVTHLKLPPNALAREASNWFDRHLGVPGSP
jgi:DNA-binding winged helix-turn-helix (wHTH) protein